MFDGYRTLYADNQFDLVLLSHVVEHVEHPRLLLYEAARVGKRLFVEVPLEDNVRLSDDFVFDHVGHINVYSRKTMRREQLARISRRVFVRKSRHQQGRVAPERPLFSFRFA